MRNAKTVDELAILWEEFLAEQHRVYIRLKKATEQIKGGKSWFEAIEVAQRSDELLQYVFQARGANEHGIENITAKEDGGWRLKPKSGNSIHVKHMEVRGSPEGTSILMDHETGNQVIVEFFPAQVRLIPVDSRGATYNPPTQHLGSPILDATPIMIAELAIAFLESKIREAETDFLN
jgi:hypothetical protein